MGYAQTLWLYWALVAGIILVPGMDMLLVLTHALARGLAGGLAAVAGIMLGGVVHTAWGTAGAALLLTMPHGIVVALLVAGAGYLGWIGWQLVRSSIRVGPVAATRQRLWTGFRQGAVTALLNPKAYVFVLAVLPQVIRPEFGPVWRQGLVLLAITNASQLAIYGAVALLAVPLGRGLTRSPRATAWTGRIIGGLFLIAALAMLAEALQS